MDGHVSQVEVAALLKNMFKAIVKFRVQIKESGSITSMKLASLPSNIGNFSSYAC